MISEEAEKEKGKKKRQNTEQKRDMEKKGLKSNVRRSTLKAIEREKKGEERHKT